VKTACCGGGSLGGERQCGVRGYTRCENPDEFLYWDSFNPTQRAYELIANDLWNGWLVNIRPYNLITLADLQLIPAA
jgi:phospholipase/lecithinase/hemolysin